MPADPSISSTRLTFKRGQFRSSCNSDFSAAIAFDRAGSNFRFELIRHKPVGIEQHSSHGKSLQCTVVRASGFQPLNPLLQARFKRVMSKFRRLVFGFCNRLFEFFKSLPAFGLNRHHRNAQNLLQFVAINFNSLLERRRRSCSPRRPSAGATLKPG